jgi:beta-galactosidase/beta-glucuronidase
VFFSPASAILAFTLIFRPVFGFGGGEGKGNDNFPLDNDWKFYFAGNDSNTALARYDPSRAYETINVPHTFPRKGINNTPLQGFGWYFKTINIPASFIDKDVFLKFEGACLRSEIFVDGVHAGKNDFAYMPFSIPLTPYIQGKTHVLLAVRVDNRLLSRQIPDNNARGWWMYGGLIREVYFSVRAKRRIDGAEFRTLHVTKDTFNLQIKLKPKRHPWDSVAVSMTAVEKNSYHFKAAITGADTTFRIGGIHEWTPEFPYRYAFSLVPFFKGKAGDTLKLARGFCQLTSRKTKLYLNGRPYYLRGMARHDVLGDKGPLLTREERLRDLTDLKSLGVNFLRIAHFPQHRDIYELCDSLGLLVMDEIPAWKTDGQFLESKEGHSWGADYMKGLIAAHGNYTCICMWSIGNQFASFKTSVADFVGDVSAEIKKADPSRLVTFCSYYYIWDKAFSHVDVIAVNEYFGWELASLGMLGPMLDRINKDWPDKPVLISELGAQAARGFRNPDAALAGPIKSVLSKDISEDHQALFLRSHMDTIWNKRSYVNGMVVWAYSDYMSYMNKARTAEMPVGLNCCGIVTQDRKRKLSYEVVKNRYPGFRDRFAAENAAMAAKQ